MFLYNKHIHWQRFFFNTWVL